MLRWRFRRFQTRVAVFLVGLLTMVSASTFVAVSVAVTQNARLQIRDELMVGGKVFARLFTERTRQLADAARLLSGDFAFKAAVSTDDRPTVQSVLENHRMRIAADVMQLVSLDNIVLADTLRPERAGAAFPLADLITRAPREQDASAIVVIENRAYQLVAVPVLAPLPIAWISIGFVIDDQVARDLQKVTNLHVSFLARRPDGFAPYASTLPQPMREAMRRALPAPTADGRTLSLDLGDGEYVTLLSDLGEPGRSSGIVAVLQRSLDEALQPFRRLQLVMLGLTATGVGISLLGAVAIARRVTKPVLTIADGARRVASGDYDHAIAVDQRDEIGELATTFNTMTRGLVERDRIRSELDRVGRLKQFLSPQIAEAIVSSASEDVLTSHRGDITVVFFDLRGFTAFGEHARPDEVMGFLQAYHEALGPLVSRYEATLSSFAGDGVMLFFNDPFPVPDHAERAVRLSVDMRRVMTDLTRSWRRRGHAIGFSGGIAMGFATLGRIGFEGRFDYAAIGSVTNLAARLCAEARDGQILVSQPVFEAVDSLVEAQEIRPLILKGFDKPVPAYNILEIKSEV